MKRLQFTSGVLAIATAFIAATLVQLSGTAFAFSQNSIIDTLVFDNKNSMTPASINTFLNQFPQSCISTNNHFLAIDPIGYSPTNGFSYGGSVSAGQVIYDAAQAYDINPQVLLATLQKEQSLVDGTAGCSVLRYTGAMGYGCPDGGTIHNYSGLNLYTLDGTTVTAVSGTCVNTSSKAGFTQQVIRGAWLLKFGEQRSAGNINWAIVRGSWDNSDDPQSCYSGPMTQGTWQRCPSGGSAFYDGYTTIDSTPVHMDNGATAALYWYTPHFNGNVSFSNIFTNWFGSTEFGNLVRTASGGVYFIDNGQKRAFPSQIIFLSYSYTWSGAVAITQAELDLIPDGAPMPYNVHFRDGKFVRSSGSDGVYLIENGLKRPVPDGITLLSYSYTWSNVVTISAAELPLIPDGPVVPYYVHFRDGHLVISPSGGVFDIDNGTKRPFPSGATFLSYGYKYSDALAISSAEINMIPDGTPMPPRS